MQTNMVMVNVQREFPDGILGAMDSRGIKFLDRGRGRLRLVTHYGIDEADIQQTVEAFRAVMN